MSKLLEKYSLEIITTLLIIVFGAFGFFFGMRARKDRDGDEFRPKVRNPAVWQYCPPIEPDSKED